MTRSSVKALHEKVTSLLSMCDLDTPLNGFLLHSGTLCTGSTLMMTHNGVGKMSKRRFKMIAKMTKRRPQRMVKERKKEAKPGEPASRPEPLQRQPDGSCCCYSRVPL